MLHQIVEVQQENRYLLLDRGFLKIKAEKQEVGSVPLDDIAVLMISAQGCSFSKNILSELAERGALTIICGKNYTPTAIMYPVTGQYQQAGIIQSQIDASLPLKKHIWKKVVELKLHHQSLALKEYDGKKSEFIESLSKTVKSGDLDNREGFGARVYWSSLFGNKFVRNKDGEGINALLNYGYAIMRSSMCRAICAGGLQPSLGVHHENVLNPFCLADDLFEIYRPLVDLLVHKLIEHKKNIEITPETKKQLTKCLWIKMKTTEGDSPAFQSMQYYVSSYVKSLKSKEPVLQIPVWEGKNEEFSCTEQV
jgi:CRISPR-associated protein Cas1